MTMGLHWLGARLFRSGENFARVLSRLKRACMTRSPLPLSVLENRRCSEAETSPVLVLRDSLAMWSAGG